MKKRLMLLSVLLLTITSSLLLGATGGPEEDVGDNHGIDYGVIPHRILLTQNWDGRVLIVNATQFYLYLQLAANGDDVEAPSFSLEPAEGIHNMGKLAIEEFALCTDETVLDNCAYEPTLINIDLPQLFGAVIVFFHDTRTRTVHIMRVRFETWQRAMEALRLPDGCYQPFEAAKIILESEDYGYLFSCEAFYVFGDTEATDSENDGEEEGKYAEEGGASATAAGEEGKEGDEAA
jgi:hypothetical protein